MSDALPLSDLVTLLNRAPVPVVSAHVFGSRAAGHALPDSDLDLLVDAGRRLTLSELAVLREVFDESELPMHVDVSDWHRLEPAFREDALEGAIRLEIP